MVENDLPEAADILHELYPRVGVAHRIGVTGPPGAGKSTVVEKLATHFREMGKTIAIIAVDPTSPFTGGAILGDRVRMTSLFCDPGVFIRSMATRGSLGGLARQTKSVCDLLDAFGKDIIIIETVGVGQAELDIAQAAHSTMIVLVPESGDGIQAMKAGLMEIGDLFVVNKSDRDGADRLTAEIEMMLEMRPEKEGWRPQVIRTIAVQDKGIDQVGNVILDHYAFLNEADHLNLHREESIKNEIKDRVDNHLQEQLWNNENVSNLLDNYTKETLDGKRSPISASKELIAAWEKERLSH